MYESKTVAQWYTLALGLLLLILAIVGFAVGPAAGLDKSGDFFSQFLFRPWHSGLYTLAGLLGLATWRRADSARMYAIVLGCLLAALALWGFVGDNPGWLFSSELEANIFHAMCGVASVAIGFTSPPHGEYPVFTSAEGA